MTHEQSCYTAFVAFALIEFKSPEGMNAITDILNYLHLDFSDFMTVPYTLKEKGMDRYDVYHIISNFSASDKELVKKMVLRAYDNGGKKGQADSLYYLREILTECDLATII